MAKVKITIRYRGWFFARKRTFTEVGISADMGDDWTIVRYNDTLVFSIPSSRVLEVTTNGTEG